MAITRKNQKFINEYFVDLNATQAAIRAGYSEDSARQIASALLSKADIKAEVAKRMRESRMTSDEVLARLEAMAAGEQPTKIVVVDGEKLSETYDTITALDKMGRVYALFIDKQVIEIDNLDIVDDQDTQD